MIRAVHLLTFAALLIAVQAMGRIIIAGGGDDCAEQLQCPEGYKLFSKRVNGPWCMKVFPGNMTWWEAERECRCSTKGAHLSGIETSMEARWVEEAGQKILDSKEAKNGFIWAGAYRRKECIGAAADAKSAVCHNEKVFQFTDQHTCKTHIFQKWASGQPSSVAGNDCAALLVSTETSGTNSDNAGKISAENCVQAGSSVGFVCGVKPVQGGGNYGGGYGSGYSGGLMIGAGKPEKKH